MTNSVLAIMGRKRSGKDTYASNLIFKNQKQFKFAWILKKTAFDIFESFNVDIESDEYKERLFEFQYSDFLIKTKKAFALVYNKPVDDLSIKEEHAIVSLVSKFFDESCGLIFISPRQFQQYFSTSLCRHFDNEIFIKYTLNDIDLYFNENHVDDNPIYAVITDVRFPEEVNSLSIYDTKIYYILRYNLVNGKYETFNPNYDEHVSEKLNNNLEKDILNWMNLQNVDESQFIAHLKNKYQINSEFNIIAIKNRI